MAKSELMLVKPELAIGDSGKDSETAKPEVSKLRRFLRWSNFMKTSTYNKDGETVEKDSWNFGLIFAIIILYVTVIGGFVILAIGGSIYFLEMREAQRNADKWKQVEMYDDYKRAQKQCIENAEKLQGLIRENQQAGRKVDARFLTPSDCDKAKSNESPDADH